MNSESRIAIIGAGKLLKVNTMRYSLIDTLLIFEYIQGCSACPPHYIFQKEVGLMEVPNPP